MQMRDFKGRRLIRRGSLWDKLIMVLPKWVGYYRHVRVGRDCETWSVWSWRNDDYEGR